MLAFESRAHYVYLRRDQAEHLLFFPDVQQQARLYRLFAVNVNKRLKAKWRVVWGTMAVTALQALVDSRRGGAHSRWMSLPSGQQVRTELVARMFSLALEHAGRRTRLEVAA